MIRDFIKKIPGSISLNNLLLERNIMRNSIIKTQHIIPMNAVNKNDTIIIASGSSGLSISTYGQALANGKLGDMILVKNLSSNKEFKAIITASKKVRPIY